MDSTIEYQHLPIEEYRKLPFGNLTQVLSNIFVIRVDKHQYRYGNMYVVINETKKELILIDAVREEGIFSINKLRDDGYKVKGIFITHKHLIDQAYGNIEKVSNDYDGATVFMDFQDAGKHKDFVHSVYKPHDAIAGFKLASVSMPGHTSGSVCFYVPQNGGVLFTGDAAIGSPFEVDEYYFERPPASDQGDAILQNHWAMFNVPIRHILPLHGKPEFNLTKERLQDVLNNLKKTEKTKSL